MSANNPVKTNIPAAGHFNAPPPGAPQETAQPLDPGAVAQQVDAARRNERTLAPLDFSKQGPIPAARKSSLADAAARPGRERVAAPAASNTDSPSRGVPKPIADAGKIITGGFGDAGEAQYYALDGTELREVVRSLMDNASEYIERDLRFSPAICYPRVKVTLKIQIEGFTVDQPFVLERKTEIEKTPMEVIAAKVESGEVVAVDFDVTEQVREFDDDGNAENPPNRIRESLGLPAPRKQVVRHGAGTSIVDRVVEKSELF